MSDIASRVKKIIVDKLGVDEAEVTNEASFTNDLGADSLDTVELIMEFEKEFNISIPDEQAEKLGLGERSPRARPVSARQLLDPIRLGQRAEQRGDPDDAPIPVEEARAAKLMR